MIEAKFSGILQEGFTLYHNKLLGTISNVLKNLLTYRGHRRDLVKKKNI
jgi:hypothetical protein